MSRLRFRVVLTAQFRRQFLQSMGPMTVRGAMGLQRSKGRVMWPLLCGERSFWQRRTPSTVARSGTTEKKSDTSAPMEIGLAAKDDCGSSTEEGDQRIVELALQAVYKGTDRGKCSLGIGQSRNEKACQVGKTGGLNSWHKGSGKKGSKRARDRWQGRKQNRLDLW